MIFENFGVLIYHTLVLAASKSKDIDKQDMTFSGDVPSRDASECSTEADFLQGWLNHFFTFHFNKQPKVTKSRTFFWHCFIISALNSVIVDLKTLKTD